MKSFERPRSAPQDEGRPSGDGGASVTPFPTEEERAMRKAKEMFGHLMGPMSEEELAQAKEDIDEEASKTLLHGRILELLRGGGDADIVMVNYADILPSAFSSASEGQKAAFLSRAQAEVIDILEGPVGTVWDARFADGRAVFTRKPAAEEGI